MIMQSSRHLLTLPFSHLGFGLAVAMVRHGGVFVYPPPSCVIMPEDISRPKGQEAGKLPG